MFASYILKKTNFVKILRESLPIKWFLVLFCLLVNIFIFKTEEYWGAENHPFFIATARYISSIVFGLIVFCGISSKKFPFLNPFYYICTKLSDISYVVYLTHIMIFFLMFRYKLEWIKSLDNHAVSFLLLTAVSLIFGYIVRFFEKKIMKN